ncbi:MAG: protoporphyrinogen oxidase [Caldilineaceae bacterium]
MSQTPSQVDVAIVGGGIAGMACAFHLQEKAAAAGKAVSYALLEQSDRWGGKLRTETIDGYGDAPFIVEAGPDSFITQKPWGLQLARQLGLESKFLPTNDHKRRTFVLHSGRPVAMPDGVLLIVPTKFTPFALTPLISPLGKLRMGMDLFLPAKTDDADETLADFIQRRLGREALDKLAEPLLSGIYNAEAEKQSVLATFPRFREMEKQHGSLMRGMLASRKARTAAVSPTGNGDGNGSKPLSMFMSLAGGMEEMAAALRARLTGDCRLTTGVESIQAAGAGYRLALSDSTALEAGAVVLAVPTYVAGPLLAGIAPTAAAGLGEIRYVSTGTISLAYKRDEINHPLDGFGVVIPRSENRPINAITWTSTKFDQRVPDGYALLRVFFGGSRSPEMMQRSDAEIEQIARQELRAIMDIDATPLFHRIFRWQKATPQYDVGHRERVAAMEAALPAGLHLTGSPYRGIGIPDCIHQAQQTAEKILDIG